MKEKIITGAIFACIIISSFYFGFSRLQNFSGVDEPYWSYARVPNFWNAVKTKKWKNTNISDKPGITIAAVSGLGLPFSNENPKSLKSLRYAPKTPDQLQKIKDLYFYLRLPVFLFTLLILPLFYFLINKLLGRNVARLAIIFIGLSPPLFGISLIINADAMLWILTALSTLSLFVFLKTDQRKYLILSGFFLGLSVITKYVANVLFVYFFLIFLLEYLFVAHQKMEIGKYLKQALVNYLILFATALVAAFLFFPATWVKFSVLFNATIGNAVFSSTWPLFAGTIALLAFDIFALKTRFSTIIFGFFVKQQKWIIRAAGALFLLLTVFVLLHVYARLSVFDLQALISSPKGIGSGNILQRYVGALSADLFSLLFSISPLVFLSLLFAVAGLFRKQALNRESSIIAYLIIFIFIFYLGSTVNDVITTVRYQIMTYPLVFVVAAIGLDQFLQTKNIHKYIPRMAAYAVAIFVLALSLFLVRPNFLAYASEILPKNFIVNLKGMGEGSYEAAAYLNSLPGAHEMTIWSDKGAVCERFVGRCFIDFRPRTFEQNKFDYFVVSTDRKSRTLKMSGSIQDKFDFKKAYGTNNPAFEIVIDNNPNDFVKVIKAE